MVKLLIHRPDLTILMRTPAEVCTPRSLRPPSSPPNPMIRNVYRLLGPLFVVVAAQAAVVRAEMFLGSMSPGSVARGGTTRVVLQGTELGDPLDLWTSVAGGKIRARVVAGEATADRVVLDVTTATDCPLGLHGLRLATDDGLSNVVLFLVDDLAPVLLTPGPSPLRGEGSSHGRGDEAAVKLPVALAGTFRHSEVDRFAVDVAAGDELSFECVSSRFGKDADPLIRILDARGKVVAEHDNDPGLFFDFRFAQKFAAAGRYTVELCDARYHGDPEWSYVLRIGKFPAARVVVPSVVLPGTKTSATLPELADAAATLAAPNDAQLGRTYHEHRRPGDDAATWLSASVVKLSPLAEVEPNNAATEATKATVGSVLCGVLATPGDRDFYEFELKKGDKLFVRAETATLDSPADVELAVIAPDDREMMRVDDVLGEEASLTVAANRDGPYRLLVHDVTRGGGPAYAYRIEVKKAGPHLGLVADFAELTIPQGEYQSLPLVLTRTDYAGPVKLQLLGAPSGVVLEPDVIPEGATTLLAHVRADAAAPLGNATLQVVGTADVETPGAESVKLSTIAEVKPLIDRQRYNVDLIKYALRENQRRLPPSVANRIALQITPPAPFTVETPEPLITLVRYLTAEFPIQVSRRGGFAEPLQFKAVGGQLGEESEIRRQIFTRFTSAGPEQKTVVGTFYSRNLPQEQKQRVDLSADGEHRGRRVQLMRSFEMELKAGYEVDCEPKGTVIPPGESVKFQFTAKRLPPFTGEITIETTPTPGVILPETIVIPAGSPSVEFEAKTAADITPAKLKIRYMTKAQVGEFQEEARPKTIDFEVKIPQPEKPKTVPPKPAAKPAPAQPPVKK